MPIITPAQLGTHIYPEIIDEITRTDSTIAASAIAAAISEAGMYLSRYNVPALLGTPADEPTIVDEYLRNLVKDLACWHLIRLSHTGIDATVYRTAYTDALATLKNISTGAIVPTGWPYAGAEQPGSLPDGNTISWTSNPRRENHY